MIATEINKMEGLADECHFDDLYADLERLAEALEAGPFEFVQHVTDHVFAAVACKEASSPDRQYSIVVTHRFGHRGAYCFHDWVKSFIVDIDVEFYMGESGSSEETWSSAFAELKDVRIVGYEPNLIIDRCLARPFGCSFGVEDIAREAGTSSWKTVCYLKDMARVGGIVRSNPRCACVDECLSFAVTDPVKLSAMRVIPPRKPFAIRKSVKDRLHDSDWEEKSFLYSWRYMDNGYEVAILEERDGHHRVSLIACPGMTSCFDVIRRRAFRLTVSKLGLKSVGKCKPWNEEYSDVPWRKLPRFMKTYRDQYRSLMSEYWKEQSKRRNG